MGCGYACAGCGRCRGKARALNITATCFRCGFDNGQARGDAHDAAWSCPTAAAEGR